MTILGAEFIPNWSSVSRNAHSALFDVWAMVKIVQHLGLTFRDDDLVSVEKIIADLKEDKVQNQVDHSATVEFHRNRVRIHANFYNLLFSLIY